MRLLQLLWLRLLLVLLLLPLLGNTGGILPPPHRISCAPETTATAWLQSCVK